MKYPYSKEEGAIILGLMLLIWGLGARFESYTLVSNILLGVGVVLLVPMLFICYISKKKP